MAQLIPDPEFNDPSKWIIPNPAEAVIEDGHLQLINCQGAADRPRTPPLAFVAGKKYFIKINISAWTAERDLHVFVANASGAILASYKLNDPFPANGVPGLYTVQHVAGPDDSEIHIGDQMGGFGGTADATIESLYVYSADHFGLAESIAESIAKSISE